MPKQLNVTPDQWNLEFAAGKWSYLDKSPIERARNAIIGMLCQQYAPDGKILDVGCGEGTLTDFLNSEQRNKYLGIDISVEALRLARQKSNLNFILADAEFFQTDHKFDVIVLNEILYYLNNTTALKKYTGLLNNNGVIILSVYRMKAERYDKKILRHAHTALKSLDAIEITGTTKKQKVTWHIETFKPTHPYSS